MAPKPVTGPRLVIIEGKEKGKIISIDAGTAVIGRSKGDVLIQDPRISRSHVAIHFDDRNGKVMFTDLKSLNGTLLNGEAHETGELHDGDRLQLGNTLFDCQIGANESLSGATEANTKAKPRAAKPLLTPTTDENQSETHTPLPEEPELPDFAEGSSPEMNVAPSEAQDPATGLNSEPEEGEPHEVTHEAALPAYKKIYLSIPRKTRVYALCGVVLVLALIYGTMSGSKSGSSPARGVASIRRLEQEGKLVEAVAAAESLRESNPKDAEVHLLLGDLYLTQGKSDLALGSLRKAQELDPSRGIIFVKLAKLYLLEGHLKEAEQANQQIDLLITQGSQTRDFFVEVANLYLDFRDLDVPPQKMVIIGQALQNKFAPNEAIGMKLEAVGLILQNYPDQAFPILEKAHNADPQDQSIFQYEVISKLKQKDFEGATTILQDWAKQFPEAARPILALAQIKSDNHDVQGAMALLQKIVTLSAKHPEDPAVAESLNLLGRLYAQQNQNQEAEGALRQSCQLGYQPSCELLKGSAPSNFPQGSEPPAKDADASSAKP